jgi:hypothetical protein
MKFSERILGTRGNNFLRFSTMQTKQKFSFLKFTRCHGPHHGTNKACPIAVMKWFMTAGRMQTKQKIAFLKFIGIALLIPLIVIDCREDATSPTPLTISISAEDVGVTDAIIKLRAESGEFGATSFQLRRNGKTIFTLTPPPLVQHSILDTVVLDDSLSPNQSYTYKAYRMIATAAIDSSTPLTLTTMDTTSHNFTWQIDTLGDGNSSVLRDVAIINDTLAYAVGEIYKKDSTGQFETTMYNIAKWNGHDWKLERAYFYWQGQPYVTQLYSIFAFAEDDIWVGTGGPYHWDGHTWTTYNMNGIFNGVINKFWGTSSSNLFIVGTNGSIAHFNGSSWRKIESGTTTDINDVWGVLNTASSKQEVYCAVSDIWVRKDRKILKITNINHVDSIEWSPNRSITSVWTNKGFPLYACGDGIFENSRNYWKEVNIGVNIFSNRVRGNNVNDIFIVGPFGLFAHFNGVSWKLLQAGALGDYVSVCTKGNLVIAVGVQQERAFTAIGKNEIK